MATQEEENGVESAKRKLYVTQRMQRQTERLGVPVELETTTVAAADAARVIAS